MTNEFVGNSAIAALERVRDQLLQKAESDYQVAVAGGADAVVAQATRQTTIKFNSCRAHRGSRTDSAKEIVVNEREEIETFLGELRSHGSDPAFLTPLLTWLAATGGVHTPTLNKALDIARSDAPLRARARELTGMLQRALAAHSRASFS